MFRASPDALIVVGTDGVIEVAGPATSTIFGYEPDELVGQPIEVLLPEETRVLHRVYRATYAAAPESRAMGVGRELYGRHRNGSVFPVDVSLVPTVIDGRRRFGAFVRDATERRRGEDILRFINQISRGVIRSQATGELLDATAHRARILVGARAAWISVLAGDEMVVAAADGEAADTLAGAGLPAEQSIAARAMRHSETVEVADMAAEPGVLPEARSAGFGPGLYLPMQAEEGPVGSLVLVRGQGDLPFDQEERAAAEVFASAAAIVLALASARESRDRMRIAAEHERIGRDLHDTVIQRLFGLGIRLQAAERMADDAVAERIRTAVDAIDDVIREIRETIFDLNRPDGDDGLSLRSRARSLIDEAAETLGFRPRLAFRGPVHSVVSGETSAQVLAALRDALANVGRHAKASAVDIAVSVAEGSVVLTVSDDGVPGGEDPEATNGLTDLIDRAAAVGGQCTVTPRSPSGTLIRWSVPMDAA
ncbi:MAG TPA: PAS domain S-box protein [Acidimicrobiales bacterium]|nr:PAS domain S-box protein [Acidimicrobiales bacterium]